MGGDLFGSVTFNNIEITEDMLVEASAKALANFGKPSIMMGMGTTYTFNMLLNPEYSGTDWAYIKRPTRRERAVAGLHTTLEKLSTLKNISENDKIKIVNTSIKRLTLAKWARYKKNNV
jgi:hypothetical protein